MGATKFHHIEGVVKAVNLELSSSEIEYSVEAYVPHKVVGVMAQNTRKSKGMKMKKLRKFNSICFTSS